MRTFILFFLMASQTVQARQSPREIIRSSAQKVLEIESFEYDLKNEDFFEGGEYVLSHTHVKSMRNPNGKPYFLVNGDKFVSVNQTTTLLHYAMTDSGWRTIDHERGIYKYFDGKMDHFEHLGYRVSTEGGSTFDHFLRSDPMNSKQNYEYTMEGEEVFGGVMCYVISMPYKARLPGEGKFYWYIAKDDLLPRGYKSDSDQMEVSNLKVNSLSSPESFELAVPEGYVKRHLDDSDNTLKKQRIAEADDTGIFYSKGKQFPSWSLADAEGNILSDQSLRGKVVVYDFWGSWCYPCLQAMPKLQKLHESFKRDDVVVIGFSVKDKPGKAEAFMQKERYTYVHVPNADKVAKDARIQVYPTFFIVDQLGRVVHAERSFRSNAYEEWVDIIKGQLGK